HLPVNIELLILRNVELLIRAVFQGQNDGRRRSDMPYFSSNALYSRYDFWGCSSGHRFLKLHARLKIVDPEFLAVYRDTSTLRHIGDVLDGAVFHFHDKIVTRNMHDLTSLYSCLLRGRLRCFGGVGLYLSLCT